MVDFCNHIEKESTCTLGAKEIIQSECNLQGKYGYVCKSLYEAPFASLCVGILFDRRSVRNASDTENLLDCLIKIVISLSAIKVYSNAHVHISSNMSCQLEIQLEIEK